MPKEKKIVVFNIDAEEFAADISQVERILGYIEPTKVPESPPYIKGVIKYQDRILPVMDIKKRFNLLATALKDDPKIIVVKHEDKKVGLIVDTVSEVIDVNEDLIENAPEIVKGISNRYVTGMIKLDNRIIILINTENILSKDEIKELSLLTQ